MPTTTDSTSATAAIERPPELRQQCCWLLPVIFRETNKRLEKLKSIYWADRLQLLSLRLHSECLTVKLTCSGHGAEIDANMPI
jgi:hypothetical protein